ncbi:hypothetical protein EV143_10755 [Flavobacterium chryseum]|nr:hypothetical protein EV143_10755 [Flavobacterium sp. P3160]
MSKVSDFKVYFNINRNELMTKNLKFLLSSDLELYIFLFHAKYFVSKVNDLFLCFNIKNQP